MLQRSQFWNKICHGLSWFESEFILIFVPDLNVYFDFLPITLSQLDAGTPLMALFVVILKIICLYLIFMIFLK